MTAFYRGPVFCMGRVLFPNFRMVCRAVGNGSPLRKLITAFFPKGSLFREASCLNRNVCFTYNSFQPKALRNVFLCSLLKKR